MTNSRPGLAATSLERALIAMALQYSESLAAALREVEDVMMDHARSIGELCMSWAVLDRSIDDIFGPLIQHDKGVVACLATSMEKPDARIAVIKRLFVHFDVEIEWRRWAESLFNRVVTELGPLRNRYVHDRWVLRNGEMETVDKRAKIRKVQSREPDKLVFDNSKVTTVDKVDRLRDYIDTVIVGLNFMQLDLEAWRNSGFSGLSHKFWPEFGRERTRLVRYPTLIVNPGRGGQSLEFVTDE